MNLRLLTQPIRVKLNVEVIVIPGGSNPNHLWNWMNALLIFIHNLKLPNFEILFFELPNHFLHFNELLGKTMPKLLGTYGMSIVR